MTLQWKKHTGADGYMLYTNKCGNEKPKLKKIVKNPNTTSWKRTGLKKATYYKYMVVAYKNVNGKRLPIAASCIVHCTTKAKKHTIAKSVKVNETEVMLLTGKTFTIKSSEVKAEKGKTIKKHRNINYESGNPKIATVTKVSGKIKAKSPGTTYVYAYAQDGVFKRIKVIVGTKADLDKAKADKLASAFGTDEETAAEMLKTGQEMGVSMDTMLLTTKAIGKLPNDNDPKGSSYSKLRARAVKRTSTTMTLQWKKHTGADGYMLYTNKCGNQKPKLKKIIKNPNTTSWKRRGLRKATYYKYMVVAYKNVNGKRLPIAVSCVVHCTTKAKKHTIAKGVKVNKTSVTLKKGKTFTIKSSEIKAEKGKTIKKHRNINYESGNPKVATVTKVSGKIRAKKKGTTYIYAYAQDGVYKRIKVVVK
jgi:uncharacterized protein YjdB